MTIRISPEQVEIGGLMHDNLWPDETPIGYVPDETSPKEDEPSVLSRVADVLDKLPREWPQSDTTRGFVITPPPVVPPLSIPLPGPVTTPAPMPDLPASMPPLMRQVMAWMQGKTGKAVLIGASVLLVAYLVYKLSQGPKNEVDPLTENEENRYQELEGKRSQALANGQKLSSQEEAEWQDLEDRKFPNGRNGIPPKIEINPKKTGHIFMIEEGHYPDDTPANRQKLEDVANNPDNRLGTDKYGTDWYAEVQPDGSQIWVQVRNGKINNGGVNKKPKVFNPDTGLSAPTPPGYPSPGNPKPRNLPPGTPPPPRNPPPGVPPTPSPRNPPSNIP